MQAAKAVERLHICAGSSELLLLDNTRPPDECVLEIYFLYFSSKTYVVGAQKNRLNEHPKHMFKLMGKKIITILHS